VKLDDRPQQGDKIGVDWHGARVSVSLTLQVPLFVLDANGLPLVGISAGNGVWGRLHEAVLHRLDDAGLIDVTRVVLDTAHVRAKKGPDQEPAAGGRLEYPEAGDSWRQAHPLTRT
jgi:hypothetical protein